MKEDKKFLRKELDERDETIAGLNEDLKRQRIQFGKEKKELA